MVELLLLRGCRGFCVAIGCVVGGTLAPGDTDCGGGGGGGVEIECEHCKAQPNILSGVLRILGWIAIVVLLSIAAGALPFALSLFCRLSAPFKI